MAVNWRVLFNRGSAVLWVVAGVLAFPLGWAYSVAFVTLASIYANVKTDWGTAEAADDRAVLKELAELRREVRAGACHCAQPVQQEGRRDV